MLRAGKQFLVLLVKAGGEVPKVAGEKGTQVEEFYLFVVRVGRHQCNELGDEGALRRLTAHKLIASPTIARAGEEGRNMNDECYDGKPPRQVQQQEDQRDQGYRGAAKVEGLRDHRNRLVGGLVGSLAHLIIKLGILKKRQVERVGFLEDIQLHAVRHLFLQELLHDIAERTEQA